MFWRTWRKQHTKLSSHFRNTSQQQRRKIVCFSHSTVTRKRLNVYKGDEAPAMSDWQREWGRGFPFSSTARKSFLQRRKKYVWRKPASLNLWEYPRIAEFGVLLEVIYSESCRDVLSSKNCELSSLRTGIGATNS
ncbi:hypothetical protein AVEN_101428-1 [Araneus ventricosus]|uniref:Uncharacterized protein n=1 Tax=Araneus ventricosus TaxID=182803 RepID=A0A4Y2CWS5_ARAVE|nr:hypothetical protein AVEN_101428-1 [Araneus ventricosus]